MEVSMIIDKGRLLNSAKKIINTEKNNIKINKNTPNKKIKDYDRSDISTKLKIINKQINNISTEISSFQSTAEALTKIIEYSKNHNLNDSKLFFQSETNNLNNKTLDVDKISNAGEMKLFENTIKTELDRLKSQIDKKTDNIKELNISLQNISSITINSKNEANKIIESISGNIVNLYSSINNINIDNLFDII